MVTGVLNSVDRRSGKPHNVLARFSSECNGVATSEKRQGNNNNINFSPVYTMRGSTILPTTPVRTNAACLLCDAQLLDSASEVLFVFDFEILHSGRPRNTVDKLSRLYSLSLDSCGLPPVVLSGVFPLMSPTEAGGLWFMWGEDALVNINQNQPTPASRGFPSYQDPVAQRRKLLSHETEPHNASCRQGFFSFFPAIFW
jgi:hypothetical protein